jgi:UDP-3-O-[3-hydroxymyristoyl] N-acetylglucosamine deacetylase
MIGQNQKTIKREVAFQGRGLHSGRLVNLRILPAAPDSGVIFVRMDQGGLEIPARRQFLEATHLSTTLARRGVRVGTVEHLLGAVTGLGIDNLRVELDGPEVPIADGSAAPFVAALREAGELRQKSPRRVLSILKPILVAEGDKKMAVFPANDSRATYAIDFPDTAIGYQEKDVRLNAGQFAEEIAPARTFCLLRDVEAMIRHGYALGGSLENAVVVGDDGILAGSLRFQDEFVRHKILDLMGDLALLGYPLRGHVVAFKGGHRLHGALVDRILRTPEAWVLDTHGGMIPAHLLRRYEGQKAGVLPGQPISI